MMRNWRQISILITLSTICVLGHMFSPPSWGLAHDFLFKFTYLPIVLSAIWYGRWFALQMTTLFCLLYLFHIFVQLYHHSHHNVFSILLDLGLYFIVAWITGRLSDAQKEKTFHLNQAYKDLKEKTALVLEFEKNARKNERLKIMGELAGTVAHEVRTPLSALQGAVEIVASEKSDDETRKKFSQTVFEEVQRINKVVGNFLKLGQEQNVKTELIPLKKFLLENMIFLKPLLNKKKIELITEIPEELSVLAYKDQLKQVFLNMILNSSEWIKGDDGRIVVRAHQEQEKVFISIIDNGQGVSEELLDRIFDPFVTGRKDGSGLGLYISRNILRSFGGDLTLTSSRSGETVFSIVLKENE